MNAHFCVSLVPLFNHLQREDQQKINQLAVHEQRKKGEVILSPNDEPQLVIVARGQLKTYQLSQSGKEQLLRVVEPGQYEGENLLFGIRNENLFVEATQDTEICVLKQSDFQNLLTSYPKITLQLLTMNAEKVAQLEQQAQFLTMEKVEERLVTYLLDLHKSTHETIVTIPMKMKELAAFLGTTPETLSRKLKLLEEQQLIKRTRNKIQLCSIEALQRHNEIV